MATPAHRLLQDQNLYILDNGVAPGGKTTYTKQADKKVVRRRALNDISNSRKPSLHQPSKNGNSTVGVCTDTFAAKQPKPKPSKAVPEKAKASGRKALTDVTNLAKSTFEDGPTLTIPSNVAEERFMHNHQQCITAQKKAVDMKYFLKSAGLHQDDAPLSAGRDLPPLAPKKQFKEMEDDDALLGWFSPTRCGSPQSPESLHMRWEVDESLDFKIVGTPEN